MLKKKANKKPFSIVAPDAEEAQEMKMKMKTKRTRKRALPPDPKMSKRGKKKKVAY